MRILVLTDDNGTTRVRESREVFDVAEFKLVYTCPDCKNEFIFTADKEGEPKQSWRACPVCAKNLTLFDTGTATPEVLLWEALSLYRSFYEFVTTRHPFPELKLLVTVPAAEPKPASSPAKPTAT
jgi:transposase-like protein